MYLEKNQKKVYQGTLHQIVQAEVEIEGKVKVFEKAERPPGTRLIIMRNDQMLLTKEWRKEQNCWDYRLPGGKVFDSLSEFNEYQDAGGNILAAAEKGAVKEASEEAGISVNSLELLEKTVCGATISWDLYYFVVKEFEQLENQDLEEGEHIETHWYSVPEVRELCFTGLMKEDRTVAVLLRYLHSLSTSPS